MATEDISRAAFDPRKHYSAVHMQQGRVMVDDDWNESERIAGADRRLTRMHVIGAAGSPDKGFAIQKPAAGAGGLLDFEIQAGNFYLGGVRLTLESPQTFRAQSDFLTGPGDGTLLPTAERIDLVYLLAGQLAVSAMEDNELFEVALGGPDTSTRIRTLQRVFVAPGVSEDDCGPAWQKLVADFAAQGLGALGPGNELVRDTTLAVSFAPGGVGDDLCAPSAAGGYLGAENQTIRVQLVDTDHFTWGLDNAAPLYRVQVAADRQTLTLLNEPKDQAHWPLAGQVVEVLAWGAVLPNHEKIAEGTGHLTRLAASYNPDTAQLVLVDPIPLAGFEDWKNRADAGDLAQPQEYYYFRVWNRGSDRTSPPAVPFAAATPVVLGNTGLLVTINGNDRRAGDYWVMAVRPETPNRVVPWDFETGRRPNGMALFAAPLALIHWEFTADVLTGVEVLDCRPTFRPLTEQQDCCRFDVGDGKTSHGHFDSLEEALLNLPGAGGVICLLPGDHETNVIIEQRKNIHISGCGKNSRVMPRPEQCTEPIFTIRDSQEITLEGLEFVQLQGRAIVLEGTKEDDVAQVEICNNGFITLGSAVRVTNGNLINIHHNRMRSLDRTGGEVAILLAADDSRIERNDLAVVPAGTLPPPRPGAPPEVGDNQPPDPADPCADVLKIYRNPRYLSLYSRFILGLNFIRRLPVNPFVTPGGIQIGNGSERVVVTENQILGGAGNGITLGSNLVLPDLSGLDPQAQPPKKFRTQSERVEGRVIFEEGTLPGATLQFSSDDGQILTLVADNEGNFRSTELRLGPTYLVIITDPKFRIDKIETRMNPENGAQEMYPVVVKAPESPVDFSGLFGFLYEIKLNDNTIGNMGRSGIGIPALTLTQIRGLAKLGERFPQEAALQLALNLLRQFGVVGGMVNKLSITRNHIFKCVQNIQREEETDLAKTIGKAGISLGLCEDVFIFENRIEENGVNHLRPVCGIFVTFAAELDISHNQIKNNGALDAQTHDAFQPGLRGGIVAHAGARSLVQAFQNPLQDPAAVRLNARNQPLLTRHSARIHDNLVHQPLDRALTLYTQGSVSVINNQFITDVAGAIEGMQVNAGAVLVLNSSQIFKIGLAQPDRALYQINLAADNLLFSNNQTTLGSSGNSMTCQAIFGNDVNFNGNQCQVQQSTPALLINTLVQGNTVRAMDNRLFEPDKVG